MNNLLESKFKEIQKSDIDFLKTQLFKYDTYLQFDEYVFHVSENLQTFQEVMKTYHHDMILCPHFMINAFSEL